MRKVRHVITFIIIFTLTICPFAVTANAAGFSPDDSDYSVVSESYTGEETVEAYIGEAYVVDDLTADTESILQSETASSSDNDIYYISGTFCYDLAFRVLELVNEERAKYGKSRLYMDPDLLEAAMQRSVEIALFYDRYHRRPDGTKCYTASPLLYGENIALGQNSPEQVMEAWMSSEGHRENILRDRFTSIGIGVFYSNGTLSWVQDFGANEISSNCPQPANVVRTAKIEVGEIEGVTYGYYYQPVSTPVTRVGKNTDLRQNNYYNIYFQNPGWEYQWVKIENTSFSFRNHDSDIASISNGVATGKKTGSTTVDILNSTESYVFAAIDLSVLDTYADVNTNDWFYDSVIYMFNNGYMTGYGGTDYFGPNETLTREQFATILYRIEGEPEASYDGRFPDVPYGDWYTKAIAWASQNGVITGYEDGTFGTGDPITREQLATMIYRYAKISGRYTPAAADLSKFEDYELVSSWATEAVEWCVAKKIITGANGGKYINPAATAKRCECATMVYRFLEN